MGKRNRVQEQNENNSDQLQSDTRTAEKHTSLDQISRPRSYTVSLALPGSIISNAQTTELKTYLAGQIARAATIFNIDEIIVFSEDGSKQAIEGNFEKNSKKTNENVFLARILQYLECPQYLRKSLFPVHRDLRYAGLLNPLDAPHHLRADKVCKYREGVSVKNTDHGTLVDVGLRQHVLIPDKIPANVRITVSLTNPANVCKCAKGTAVSPTRPKEDLGLYWGYTTRMAAGLSEVFSNCPYESGYDLALGTSERGKIAQDRDFKLRPFKHLLIVFGGLGGIESCVEGDERLPCNRAEELFDDYINTCVHQGSGTIRTEEAILVSMSVLHPLILQNPSL